jgi:four helix bundle protein
MKDFRKLKVWKKAHLLTRAVYTATTNFPKEETYGLTSQIRRASASVPANIAEGCGRNGEAELARFLHVAMGSASELEYHLLLAHDLNLMETRTYEQLNTDLIEVKRMLSSFIQKLKTER